MCKRKLKLLLLSLFFCLLLSGGLCSAADLTMTQDEFNALKQNSIQLDRIITILSQSSNQSAKQLIEVEAKLAKVEQQLLQSENALKQMESLLLKQDASITQANQFLTAYSQEQKAIQAKLKSERTLWQIVAIVGGVCAIVK